ncbi:hypothetical protein CLU79DRAFT_753992 [Phycomyces nitens]|nr:hypothetical protein CLU79DRAFT_753992 [Phycomyces nitens]
MYSSRRLPLTKENLSRKEREEAELHSSNISRRRRTSTKDCVMESPRLMPFPYHNDSCFLPTVEHPQSKQPTTESYVSLSNTAFSSCSPSSYASTRTPCSLSTEKRSVSFAAPLENGFDKLDKSKSSPARRLLSRGKINVPGTRFVHFCRKWLGKREPETRLTENSPVWYSRFDSNPVPPQGLQYAVASY